MVIVSREQGWQVASSSSPSSLRKLQVPTFYSYPPKGAIFMLQLMCTTFNSLSIFFHFHFVLLIFLFASLSYFFFPFFFSCFFSYIFIEFSCSLSASLQPVRTIHALLQSCWSFRYYLFFFSPASATFMLQLVGTTFFLSLLSSFLKIFLFSPIVFGPGSRG